MVAQVNEYGMPVNPTMTPDEIWQVWKQEQEDYRIHLFDPFTLVTGGDRRKNPERCMYRYMRADEFRALGYTSTWQRFKSIQGDARQCRMSGKARTWKRTPERYEVPFKYGMYESTVFSVDSDGAVSNMAGCHLLVKLEIITDPEVYAPVG